MTDEVFAQAMLGMRKTMYRVSYGLLRQEQDRLDAVQEALARAWEKRAALRDDRYLRTWLVRILINECHNIQRRQGRDVALYALQHDASNSIPADADMDAHDAVLALPQALRLPVILHYMEGYSLQEIANMLRLPLGTVGTRLHRARRRLRSCLTDDEEV